MDVHDAEFISSIVDLRDMPAKERPEFAFIGRSNVGKSSLINMLIGRKKLAKTSGTPGKTQTINHYAINQQWYMVDLPGYGYANVSKEKKSGFGNLITRYVTRSPKLFCLFVLIDLRLKPQPIDIQFINWVGEQQIPIAIIFTKSDKLSKTEIALNKKHFENELLRYWDELPPLFISSSTKRTGRDEILSFIQQSLYHKK